MVTGARFEGDTTYPLSEEEKAQFRAQFTFDAKLPADQIKKGLDALLQTPYGCFLARESIESEERYTVMHDPANPQNKGSNPTSTSFIKLGVDFVKNSTPEEIAATVMHEMYHVQQSSLSRRFRSAVSIDAPTQALSTQMATTLYEETGQNIGIVPEYHAEWTQRMDECFAYAQGLGPKPEWLDDDFEQAKNLTPEELKDAQKAFAKQATTEYMTEWYQDTFNTDLEDWRPGEQIMSRDIAATHCAYVAQDHENEEETNNFRRFCGKFNAIGNNNAAKKPSRYSEGFLKEMGEYVDKEAQALGEDTPMAKAMRAAYKKMGQNRPKLTNQELALIYYATAQQMPGLDENRRTAEAFQAGMMYDSNLSDNRKSKDSVRAQMIQETQEMTGNPQMPPTYEQEQEQKRAREAGQSGKEATPAAPVVPREDEAEAARTETASRSVQRSGGRD